jgi:hypothetical protein
LPALPRKPRDGRKRWEIADAGGKNILEKDANQLLEQKTPAEQIDVL